MASSVGGLVFIDFADPKKPVVEKVDFDFAHCGHTLCIIDSHASHADLTDEYAAIPVEMKKVAAFFGKEVLNDVEEARSTLPFLPFASAAATAPFCARCTILKRISASGSRRARCETTILERFDLRQRLRPLVVAQAPERHAAGCGRASGHGLLRSRCARSCSTVRARSASMAAALRARRLPSSPTTASERFKEGVEQVLGEGSCHPLKIKE